jgi:hypothetical protein
MKNHEFLVRASSIGDLMTRGRTKDAEWGETALAVIQKAVLFNKYGIEENITSKHMEKGILNERESLEMYRKVIGANFDLDETKQRLVNNYCTGETDKIHDEIVVDIKSSWSAKSFPWWDSEIKNKSYIFQLQCYLWLTGLKRARLVYALTTTPEHIRLQEIQRVWYRLMDKPENQLLPAFEVEQMAEEIVNKEMVFDHIPIINRVKIFEVERDDVMIESIQKRIEEARVKYDELYSLI